MSSTSHSRAKPLTDPGILRRAVVDSFVKLDPRKMVKNPVMFVVEVGAVVTSIEWARDLLHQVSGTGFGLQISLWLWFTVLFANFAEAMAEGRGKAQAENLRKARTETMARKLKEDATTETVPSTALRAGDLV